MEQTIQTITKINEVVNNFIWGPYMLVFFLFVGLMFTVRTKLFQITHIKEWLDVTVATQNFCQKFSKLLSKFFGKYFPD